jgi:hypothetical protein
MPVLTPNKAKLDAVLDWKAAKPATDAGWAKDVEAESLHLKFDAQLAVMLPAHERKIAPAQKEMFWHATYPDATRKELYEQFEDGGLKGAALLTAIEDELASQVEYYAWKTEKLLQSVERIEKEIDLREREVVTRKPIGTTYYIDSDNGDDALNDGTTAVKTNGDGPWATLDQFTENARVAGDIAILRRGMAARYDNGSDLTFTSDGTLVSPITIEADYSDEWGDFVDLSITATATLTFGSKTVTFSADISGVCAAGDWIYVTSEDAREFAYEVDTVSTVTVTLFLPYKGDEAGAGKAMTNMQDPPIWNTAAGNFQMNLDGDHYWKIQGLHARGTDFSGVIEVDSSIFPVFKDCIFEGNAGTDRGVHFSDDWVPSLILKCRFYNYREGIASSEGAGGFWGEAKDCLIDGNSVASSRGVNVYGGCNFLLQECELKNNAAGDLFWGAGTNQSGIARLRNCILSSGTEFDQIIASLFGEANVEDHDGVLNDTRLQSHDSSAEATPLRQSETIIVNGGTTSIKVTPSTDLATAWEHSRLLLFEYPVYATTDAKTYTVYFRPSAVGDWTDDPTAAELWIELEYWGHATNDHRRIVKSTGVIDMNGSDAWQALTVTVTPSQAGVAYLRGWYAKTKEGGKTNVFYCDTKIVIS